jgi:predicted permease
METFLAQLTSFVTPAFAITAMLAMGMRLTLGEVVAPLRDPRFVLAALALNFAAMPAAAWLIGELLGVDRDVRTGLLLIAAVAGAPLIPSSSRRCCRSSGLIMMAMLFPHAGEWSKRPSRLREAGGIVPGPS